MADEESDVVFVTNDNPRLEDPYKILDDVVSGFRDRIYESEEIKEEAMFPFLKDMYLIHPNARHETMKLQNMCRRYVIVDRWFAIRGAIAMAGENDAVLICGKGHEDYISVGNKKHWFDDRVEGEGRAQEGRRRAGGGSGHEQHPVGRETGAGGSAGTCSTRDGRESRGRTAPGRETRRDFFFHLISLRFFPPLGTLPFVPALRRSSRARVGAREPELGSRHRPGIAELLRVPIVRFYRLLEVARLRARLARERRGRLAELVERAEDGAQVPPQRRLDAVERLVHLLEETLGRARGAVDVERGARRRRRRVGGGQRARASGARGLRRRTRTHGVAREGARGRGGRRARDTGLRARPSSSRGNEGGRRASGVGRGGEAATSCARAPEFENLSGGEKRGSVASKRSKYLYTCTRRPAGCLSLAC